MYEGNRVFDVGDLSTLSAIFQEPGLTSEPPNPFQTPRRRFEAGMEQIQSQHHVSFNPPMPRPPLFSTW